MERLRALLKAIWPDAENVEKPLVFLVFSRIRRFWEPCAFWMRLGGVLERLGSVLERLGGVLEAAWRRLGASLSVLERLRASWRRLGGVLERLGASWVPLESDLA